VSWSSAVQKAVWRTLGTDDWEVAFESPTRLCLELANERRLRCPVGVEALNVTWRSKPSVVMSRYSTSAQYFGAAHLSILFLRSGIFERGDFANVMGFQRANSRIMVLVKPVPALPA